MVIPYQNFQKIPILTQKGSPSISETLSGSGSLVETSGYKRVALSGPFQNLIPLLSLPYHSVNGHKCGLKCIWSRNATSGAQVAHPPARCQKSISYSLCAGILLRSPQAGGGEMWRCGRPFWEAKRTKKGLHQHRMKVTDRSQKLRQRVRSKKKQSLSNLDCVLAGVCF